MGVESSTLLQRARVAGGLSQEELARRAGTSRPTLSAYDHGGKSPTLATAARLLTQAGFELVAEPVMHFREYPAGRGRTGWVSDRLPRLPVQRALARVMLPLHLNWTTPGRPFDLRSRRDRARVYEMVLCEGQPDDIRAYVDGALSASTARSTSSCSSRRPMSSRTNIAPLCRVSIRQPRSRAAASNATTAAGRSPRPGAVKKSRSRVGRSLVDLWDELVLPRDVRVAWQPAIDAALDAAAE
jgi:transcriptional regulator with XRE-family HTH domain